MKNFILYFGILINIPIEGHSATLIDDKESNRPSLTTQLTNRELDLCKISHWTKLTYILAAKEMETWKSKYTKFLIEKPLMQQARLVQWVENFSDNAPISHVDFYYYLVAFAQLESLGKVDEAFARKTTIKTLMDLREAFELNPSFSHGWETEKGRDSTRRW